MDSILISTTHTHPAHAEGEEDRYKYISHHTHTHTQNKSSSEIAFVVLRLHCQLKVYCDCIAAQGFPDRSPRTLRVFGDLMSNISATRGRPNMRFCVCGNPSEDLSHSKSHDWLLSVRFFPEPFRELKSQDHTVWGVGLTQQID